MKKRDFIQTACIQFMPEVQWDMAKAIKYAEKLWLKLTEQGYGELKTEEPRDIPKAYDKLAPVMKAAFDLFWLAFDLKTCSKDKAAARWLQMGELSKAEYDAIIAGAKRTAKERKTLPDGQAPKHAQGWLTERRWLSYTETATEQGKKQASLHQQQLQKINGDLAHAKHMADLTGEQWWSDETDRLTHQLKLLRDPHEN